MRNILRIPAAALGAALTAASVAAPTTAWDTTTRATMPERTLLPGLATQSPAAFNGQLAAVDAQGNLVVVATEADDIEGCLVTLKYSSSGVVTWRQGVCGYRNTYGVAIAVDAAGNVLVTGAVNGDLRMRKLAGTNGAVLWDQPGGGENPFGMALTPTGDAIALASVRTLKNDLRVVRRRGSDGALVWQQTLDSGADDAPAGIAVDAAGNVAVAGAFRNARNDDDWFAARLDAAGSVRWQRTYDSGGLDLAAQVALDREGNVIVTGTSAAGPSFNVVRTVKLAAGDGATLWERSHGRSGLSGARGVRVDAQGDVLVTGHGAVGSGDDDIRTLKYRGADGTLIWEASATGSRAGMDLGHALALDAQGNVFVTGATHAAGTTNPEFTTIKYSGRDGQALWTAALRGDGFGPGDSGHAVAIAGDAVYAIGSTTSAGQPSSLRIARYNDAPIAAAPVSLPPAHNVQGLWWRSPAGSEAGWGLNLTQQGDVLFATWFTYDAEGQPMWLVMSKGERAGPDSWLGTLYRMQGPSFDAVPFDPAKVAATAVGTASLSFTDADNGTFVHTVDGVSGSTPITRQVYGAPMPTCALAGEAGAQPNYQDLWWSDPAGSESGWGLNITHQGDVLFVTWFTYGPAGRGTWLVGSRVARTGNATYAGSLYRTVGPPFGAAAWDPARVGVAEAGHMSLVFHDDNRATFSYTVDGLSRTKAITRQVYASPVTRCR